jgi:hypothetical protein
MQAIITKYLPATNHKPSRIKASCERGSITVGYHSEMAGESPHIGAAQALVNKFIAEDAKQYGPHVNPWSKPRAVGQIPSGEFVHVFCGQCDATNALSKLVSLCDSHRWKANSDERDAISEAREIIKKSTN